MKTNTRAIIVLAFISIFFLMTGLAFGDDSLYIDPNGNIGIGTTNPDAKLNVQGGTDVEPPTSYPGYIVTGDLQSYNIGIDNNEIMARYNGDTSPLYIQNDGGNTILNYGGGNVAIGTSNPSSALVVYENDSNVAIHATNDQASSSNTSIYGRTRGDGTYNYAVYANSYGSGYANYGVVGKASNATYNWAGYFDGNVYGTGYANFDFYTDHTPFYEGDALSEISQISGKDGEIDHSTLPNFAYVEQEVPVFEKTELMEITADEAFETVMVERDKIVETTNEKGDIIKSKIKKGVKTESKGYQIEDGKIVEVFEETPIYETETIEIKRLRGGVYFDERTGKVYQKKGDGEIFEKDGKVYQENQIGMKVEEQRDIGAMVSILTMAVQQLNKENEDLRQRLAILESQSKEKTK